MIKMQEKEINFIKINHLNTLAVLLFAFLLIYLLKH